MIDVSAINAFIIWQEIYENGNICIMQRKNFFSLGKELCGIAKKSHLLHQFLQLEKEMLFLLKIVLH